jgi:hypothetical protein
MLTYRLTFNSPLLTLYVPALRVGAGKSGVGEGGWKVRLIPFFSSANQWWMQTEAATPPTPTLPPPVNIGQTPLDFALGDSLRLVSSL